MFTRDELINATGAVVLRDSLGNNASMFNISTDTRTIKADDIYLPLKGESFDGEKFIDKAIEAGAKAYFTTNDISAAAWPTPSPPRRAVRWATACWKPTGSPTRWKWWKKPGPRA